MAKNQNYTDSILEDINSKFDAILEIVIPMKKKVDRIPQIESDIAGIRADTRTMRIAMTETNKQVGNHETRITRLESKIA